MVNKKDSLCSLGAHNWIRVQLPGEKAWQDEMVTFDSFPNCRNILNIVGRIFKSELQSQLISLAAQKKITIKEC